LGAIEIGALDSREWLPNCGALAAQSGTCLQLELHLAIKLPMQL